jgi:hypothetical protein
MERETGFEPATSTLARSHSTTELFPLTGSTAYYLLITGSSIKKYAPPPTGNPDWEALIHIVPFKPDKIIRTGIQCENQRQP